MSKKQVSITLNSRQEDEGLSQTTTETHAGSSDPASDPHELSLGRFELSWDWTVHGEG